MIGDNEMKNSTNTITLKQATSGFENYLLVHGCTHSTANAYTSDLKQFKEFMKSHDKNLVYVDRLSYRHFLDYLAFLQAKVETKSFKRNTMDRKCDSLITFYKYLAEYNYFTLGVFNQFGINKVIDFKYKRVKSRCLKDYDNEFRPYIFSEDELNRIIFTVRNNNRCNKYRDLALFQSLIQLGIRRGTLLEIKWEDINFINQTIRLNHIKDQKITNVTISNSQTQTLEDFQFESNQNTGYIFMSNKDNRLSRTSYNDIIKKYIGLAGLGDTCATGHSFRHTFIMNQIRNNISLYKIIQYTGHKSVDALKDYVNLQPQDCGDLVAVAEQYGANKRFSIAV